MTEQPAVPGVVVIGVDDAGAIVHITDNVAAMLGWEADEVIGQPLRSLIPERFRRRHSDGFERFVETGDMQLVGRPLHVPALRADGGEEDVELVLSIPPRSDPATVIGVIRRVEALQQPTHFRLTDELRQAMDGDGPLEEIMLRSLDVVGSQLGARLGAAWVHDPWLDGLRAIVSWEADPGATPGYADARSDPAFAESTEHLADVFARGQSLWIDDLRAIEPTVERWGDGARPAASYIALVADDRSVGVVELIHATGRDLSIEGQEALTFLGSELGRLVAGRIRDDMAAAERRRVRLALESRGVATWSYRVPSGVMTADDRLAELYGLPPDTAGGHFARYADLILPDDRRETREVARAAIDRRERFEFRYRVRRPDGELRWLEGSGAPVLGVDGEIREITGVLYDVTAEVTARRELEEQARFAALAAEVGQAFVRDEPLAAKLQRTTDAIVEHLDAAFARVWTRNADADTLVLRASSGRYTHLDGAHARIRLGEYKIGRIAASMEPHLTNDVEHDENISDPEWARDEGMRSFAGYPLVVGGRCVGVLALFARHELPDGTLRALAAVADTVAVGSEQSRAAEEVMALYGESHRHAATLEAALRDRAHVAEVLQASLVPRSLPDVPGFEVRARYRAGVEEVGGDFYDVLLVGGDRWAFLIGDICGRGPEAARLTALARHSLRLAVMLGHEPVEALTALNRALLHSDNDGRFCTAVCGVISAGDGGTAQVEVGAAGHPAPLVVRESGAVEEVDVSGTLLGVLPDVSISRGDIALHPGDTIVVYTDGVIEARRDGEMFGIERLHHVVAQFAHDGAEALVDGVLAAVSDFDESASKDDLAILAIRRT
ncbi:MAG: SpoIIE family protein phosphatase [Ilumatobacter sp.]|nr:SpoIIE family protein phosphatase [Ilumatobacter sp.]